MKILTKTAAGNAFSYCPYFSAGALARKTERLAQEIWKPTGLSPIQAYALILILDYEAVQPSSLANGLLLHPGTVTHLIEKLEKKGFLERDYYHHVTFLRPTQKAEDLQEELWERQETFRKKCIQLLGEQETGNLVTAMNTATDKLIQTQLSPGGQDISAH
jgi:DNA-binding MarR family transcriptional regulator